MGGASLIVGWCGSGCWVVAGLTSHCCVVERCRSSCWVIAGLAGHRWVVIWCYSSVGCTVGIGYGRCGGWAVVVVIPITCSYHSHVSIYRVAQLT
jgi:hypothetical protein